MTFLYVLVAVSVSNLADLITIEYFPTHSECMVEKHKREQIKNTPYVYDCWVRKVEKDGTEDI